MKYILKYICRMGETKLETFDSMSACEAFMRKDYVYEIIGVWKVGEKVW